MAKSVSIEDHFTAITEAVAALESGDLSLEESLTRYEAGLKAVRAAKVMLDRYAARLTELRTEDDGSPTGAG
jgi:exodeoxyribonuclease VII small subunit